MQSGFQLCVICVLCLIVVPLPPGRNPFVVKINNNNDNNKNLDLTGTLVKRPIAASLLGLSSCRQMQRLRRSRCSTEVVRRGPLAQLDPGSPSGSAGRGKLVVSVTPHVASAGKQRKTSAAYTVVVLCHGLERATKRDPA
jgi:hypothetical protein